MLGVDPRLIVVFELNTDVDTGKFSAAELAVLDSSVSGTVVAFSSDPEMEAFLERVRAYQEGVPDEEGRTGADYESLLDAIDQVRPYGPSDRVSGRLREKLDDRPRDDILIDVECWYPGDITTGEEWLNEVAEAAVQAGGDVLDTYKNPAAALLLLRIRIPVEEVEVVAELDVIARLDVTPAAPRATATAIDVEIEDLPQILDAPPSAPVVGLIDSGVRSAHPLLAGAVVDAVALAAGIPDGEDRSGHGTAVASRLLHGDLAELLRQSPATVTPQCRILSVRVLDDDGEFPESSLWAHELEQAIRYCAENGVKIINLSVGDELTPYRGPRSTPIAGLLDQLSRELGVVILVPTGNVLPVAYTALGDDMTDRYVGDLLARDESTILDPAPAVTALTVGASVPPAASETLPHQPIGEPGWPAPFSRRGPGVERAIKPELVAPVGTLALDRRDGRPVRDQDLDCIVADGTSSERLLATRLGTSFAVPLVGHVAAAIQAEYPEFGPELIRALLLQAATDPGYQYVPEEPGRGDAQRRNLSRQLVGFGEPVIPLARFSTPHRAVLVSEQQIRPDEVHFFRIPVPSSFFESGGWRGVTVSLAFTPPTRARRLDYLGSRLRFELVRGLEAEEILELFAEMGEEEPEEEEPDDGDVDEGPDDANEGPDDANEGNRRTLSSLRSPQRPLKHPSLRSRSRGANQLGAAIFKQRLRETDGQEFILAVQNVNRWAPTDEPQPYAIAVTLWRDEDQPEIYAELEAELEARVEIELEVRTGS